MLKCKQCGGEVRKTANGYRHAVKAADGHVPEMVFQVMKPSWPPEPSTKPEFVDSGEQQIMGPTEVSDLVAERVTSEIRLFTQRLAEIITSINKLMDMCPDESSRGNVYAVIDQAMQSHFTE